MPVGPNAQSVGLLIISDAASKNPSLDKVEAELSHTLREDGKGQWYITACDILPDDANAIREKIESWTMLEQDMRLLLTSGGTGFAQRDITPETVAPLLDKHAPGLVHAMLKASLDLTPFAMMSRPVAGVRKKTLIVTLPGSPKGAKENLQAIIQLLPHACVQIAGADSRSLHEGGVQKLEQEAGIVNPGKTTVPKSNRDHHHPHSHDHFHDHSHGHGGHAIPKPHTAPQDRPKSNDPGAGPSARHRESPYPMISVEEAISTILRNTPPPKPTARPVDASLVGSVLAEDVPATDPVPAFRASIVDGYAVIVSPSGPSTKGSFPVVSVSHARPGEQPTLLPGQVARITTGAPLPPGATSVVMVEDTVLRRKTASGEEEEEVEILTDAIEVGENVREVGSDIARGEVVLRKGERITAVGGEIGLLASVGRAEVQVHERPRVGVLSTGDEIVPHDRPGGLRLGEVRDCNRPALIAALQSWGCEVVDFGIAEDTPLSLETLLRRALASTSVLLTTGGVSMGELDLLKPTLERALGGTIHFGRVRVKPGKPTTFATVSHLKDAENGSRGVGGPETSAPKLVFALSGNPASALTTAQVFVRPALERMMGVVGKAAVGEGGEKRRGFVEGGLVPMRLKEGVRRDRTREEYVRMCMDVDGEGQIWVGATGGQRSSRVGSLKEANALVRIEAGEGVAEKGTVVGGIVVDRI